MLVDGPCLRLASRRTACRKLCSVRSFSQTTLTRRSSSLPVFEESSTPNVAELLSHFRATKLIPFSLSTKQTKLVFSNRFRQRLENEVVKANVGEEEVRLEHVEYSEEKSNRAILRQVVQNATTQADWRNVVAFAQGVYRSRMTLSTMMKEYIVRKLAEARQYEILLSALRRVDDTGLSLKNELVASQAVDAIYQAAAPNFEADQIDTGLKYGEALMEVFEHKSHWGALELAPNDWRVRPTTLGPCLAIKAVKAQKFQNGKDEDGKIAIYAERVLDMWQQGGKDNRSAKPPTENMFLVAQYLRLWIPVWHGLALSQSLLGKNMPRQEVLRNALPAIQSPIDQSYELYMNWKEGRQQKLGDSMQMWPQLKAGNLVP